MEPAPPEAMGALERLYRRNVITLEEGQAAARLLTGDEKAPFPPPPPPPRAAPGTAAEGAPEASAPSPAPPGPADAPADGAGSNGATPG